MGPVHTMGGGKCPRPVGSVMSDKSPRRSAGKKPSKSVKEKRVIKKARKAVAENDRMAVFRRGEPPFGGN